MGIPKTDDLGRYLGHRLVHKGRSGYDFSDILQKVRYKLNGWKTLVLSRAARLTLAQSVLSNMGIFHMQLQRLPRRVHMELDKAIKNCVRGSTTTCKEVHLLNWNVLCSPKEEGEAGLMKAEDMNKALLIKLGWRLLTGGDETWARMLREKYIMGKDGPVSFKKKRRSSKTWQGIIWGSELLQTRLCRKVNSGNRAHFWIDRWLEDFPLIDKALLLIEDGKLNSCVKDF